MIEYNLAMNQIYKFFGFVVIVTVLANPAAVGQWKAKVDIGYDSIWSEYVSDCDCTETLE